MAQNKIQVEVAYARLDKQMIIVTDVDENSTIEDAISISGIVEYFPEIKRQKLKVGTFGKQKKLTDLVQSGDRIEIYRELQIDPKEARRKKALRDEPIFK